MRLDLQFHVVTGLLFDHQATVITNPMIGRRQLSTKAWLLRGIGSVPGRLQYVGGRLTFTAFGAGNLWPRQLRKLERDAGLIGLAERLNDGERVVVFDVPVSNDRNVCFPWYYFSGGLKVTLNGVRYRFGFDTPANTRMSSEGADLIGEISRARRNGKAWKAVLGEDGS